MTGPLSQSHPTCSEHGEWCSEACSAPVYDPAEEFCPASEDRVHCPHWWDDAAPCCRCQDDTGAGESDSHLRSPLPLYCPICRPAGNGSEGCPCGSGVAETDCHPGTKWADVMGTGHVETCGATYGSECDRCPTDKGSYVEGQS